MATLYTKNNEIIEILFPEAKYQEYLMSLNITDNANLDSKQKERIFLWAIRDYLKGDLAREELSEIAHVLLQGLQSSELYEVLEICAELNYDLSQNTIQKEINMKTGEIIRFYEHNKL